MNFENLPALQQWLTRVLRPLCDADPQALTKYVIALLKKDACEDTLRKSMEGQLEIFLQDETKKFVDQLFDVLHTGVYENVPEVPTLSVTVTNSSCENSPARPSTNVNSDLPVVPLVPAMEEGNKVLAVAGVSEISKTDSPSLPLPSNANKVETSSSSESQEFEEDRGNDNIPPSNLAVERRRRWRDKRSRSTSSDGSAHRKRKGGVGSSKNATRTEASRGRRRWSPVRRRVRRDIERRRRTRSPLRPRSISQNLRFRNRASISDRSRSRSISPSRRRRTCPPRPPSPSESNSLLDSIANKCSVRSEIVKPASAKDEKRDGSEARNRCRDFDERGLCLRGELCPFDHGLDPVVLHEVVNNESGGSTGQGSTSFSGKIPCDKPVNFMNAIMPIRPPPGLSDEYYPESPSIIPPPPMPPFGWNMRRPMRPRHMLMDPFSGRGGMLRPPMVRHMDPPLLHGQRQLISIPVDGIARPPGPQASMMPENPFAMAGARMVCRALFGMRGRGGGRGSFDHNRLGSRLGKPVNMSNCCLEVRKIPRELNKIETLINHFSRFGHVVSIQISFDNDPEGALVIFGSHAEAFQAYRSTDAVLNNRFIKVFWHNKDPPYNDRNQESVKPVDDRRQSNAPAPAPSFIPVPKPINPVESDVNRENLEGEQSVNRVNPPLVLQQEPQTMKTPTKMKNDAQRKQEMMTLMNAQINEQKQLISKLESDRSRMTNKQRDEVMKMIKTLQTSCEELKTNISNCGNGGSTTARAAAAAVPGPGESEKSLSAKHNGLNNCSKEEIKRSLLDAELDLYMSKAKGAALKL